jgi:ATP-binding cassette, subfamily B, bacterial
VTPATWRLRRYFWAERLRIALATLAMCARALVLVLLPVPMKYILNCVILGGTLPHWFARLLPDGGMSRPLLLDVLGGAMLTLALADALLDYLGTRLFLEAGMRSVFQLRRDLFGHLTNLPIAFFNERRAGELMSRLTDDVGRVQDMIVVLGTGILPHVLTLAGIAVVVLVTDWHYVVLVAAVASALAFFSQRWARMLRERLRKARQRDGELWGLAQEVLTGLPLVQSCGQQGRERRRFTGHALSSLRAVLLATRVQARIAPQVSGMIGVGIAFATWYGAREVLEGDSTPGDLLLFLAYLRALVTPSRQIAKSAPILGRSAVALERLRDVFSSSATITDRPGAAAPAGCQGLLEFRDVCFAHTPDRQTLSNISFTLAPGQTMALVGPTGAGKSTIAAVAVRFADPDSGHVLLDGTDLRDLPLAYVRDNVSLMLQDAPLLSGTVWENIAYGRPGATRDDAIAAAVAAGVDDVLRQLPRGYDQPVAERASTVSGGQRQCIAIARATLTNAPVLILDEPSSSLDAATESRIAVALLQLTARRATLVIAHRLATIRNVDKILVLEEGRVVQRGTHASLLGEGGLYASLIRAQQTGADIIPTAA